MKWPILLLVFIITSCSAQQSVQRQNVFIVVIDGARYRESFGSRDTNLPNIWNKLRNEGTIYTNVWNDSLTITCPGHSAVITGTWQDLPNDGSKRPTSPTIFELLRKQVDAPESTCYVISGKSKLAMLTHSTDSTYGKPYEARFVKPRKKNSDLETSDILDSVMTVHHPQLVVVNLPQVDVQAHDSSWEAYIEALQTADSLIGALWTRIQSDSVYRGNTTLFVTNDHGRHVDSLTQFGSFHNHGCSCDGCRRIMLLAIGPLFQPGAVVEDRRQQIDIAPTAAEILGISFPPDRGRSLLQR